MPSSGIHSSLRQRVLSTRNVTIATAIAVAIPASFAFHAQFPGDESGFLLLFAVAVGVPSAFDAYGPNFERYWNCIFATLWMCAAVVLAYVGCFAAGIDIFDISPFLSGVAAFLVAFLGPLVVLAAVN